MDFILLSWLKYFLFAQSVDMSAEMASESMEVITMAVDKHQTTKNYEVREAHTHMSII